MAFRVGEKVQHSKFGLGLVLAVTGAGDDLAYRVSFEDDGEQRRLLARLAPLTLVEGAAPKKTRKAKA